MGGITGRRGAVEQGLSDAGGNKPLWGACGGPQRAAAVFSAIVYVADPRHFSSCASVYQERSST